MKRELRKVVNRMEKYNLESSSEFRGVTRIGSYTFFATTHRILICNYMEDRWEEMNENSRSTVIENALQAITKNNNVYNIEQEKMNELKKLENINFKGTTEVKYVLDGKEIEISMDNRLLIDSIHITGSNVLYLNSKNDAVLQRGNNVVSIFLPVCLRREEK